MRTLRWVSVVLLIVLLVAGVALAPDRARGIVYAGVALLIAGLLLLVARRAGGNYIVNTLADSGTDEPAARATWSIATSLLHDIAGALVVLGVVDIAAGWLAGGTSWARSARRFATPALTAHGGLVYAGVLVLLLVLLAAGLLPAAGQLWAIVFYALLAAAGVWALRRQVIREAAGLPPVAPPSRRCHEAAASAPLVVRRHADVGPRARRAPDLAGDPRPRAGHRRAGLRRADPAADRDRRRPAPSDGKSFADTLIDRFDLTGSTADAVRQTFGGGTGGASLTTLGVLIVIFSSLSFTRAVQRTFELTWDLPKRGMRSTGWNLAWVAAFAAYLTIFPVVRGWFHGWPYNLVSLCGTFLLWLITPYLLLARRVALEAAAAAGRR